MRQPFSLLVMAVLAAVAILPGPAPASAQTASGTWTTCAGDNGQVCTVSGTRTVRFGANGVYAKRTVSGPVVCSTNVFGEPLPWVGKTCDVLSGIETTTWQTCASEGQTCTVAGPSVVRYGAGDRWFERSVTASFNCALTVFGESFYGISKTCQIRTGVTVSAPATVTVETTGNGGTAGGTASGTWTRCGGENQVCTLPAASTVRYGFNGFYAQRTLSGQFICGAVVFGDPAPGTGKGCDVLNGIENTTWQVCAGQNQTCTVSGASVVRYGSGDTWFQRSVSAPFTCTHLLFGDPLYGITKTCEVRTAYGITPAGTATGTSGGTETGAATWTRCAVENGTCTVSGTQTVRYGANGTYATRTATGSIACNNATFGDPVVNVAKTCEVQTTSTAGAGTGTAGGAGGTGGTGTGTGNTGGTGTAAGTPPGEVPLSGNVFLVNHQSGMCVSLPSGQASAGQPSQQEICRGSSADTWSFVNVGSGYQIKNLATGTCLYSDGGQTTNGPNIVQQSCSPTADGGRWQVRKLGEWFEIVGIQSGRCLTVTNGARDDRAGLSQSDCTSADYQKFSIVAAAFAPSAWTAPRTVGIVPVSAAPLPNGKLLMWGGDSQNNFGGGTNTWTTLYDPATDGATVTNVPNVGQNFCPGTNILADGRILVDGGRNPGGTSFYDPATNTWSAGPTVNVPRGYNGNTTLSTGEAMTYGGSWAGDENSDKFGEVYSPTTGKWRLLSGVSGNAAAANNSRVPAVRDNHYWLFAAANGFAFNAGPSPQMFWIDTRGNGALQGVGTRGDDGWSQSGTVTMYDVGRLLKIDGGPNDNSQTANTNVYTIDITGGPGSTPQVVKLASDPFPRVFHNSVVLPSGDVVTVGGHGLGVGFDDSKSVMIPTIWSPATGKFRLLNPIGVPRNYHSWALLMPDGRVVSGGGGLCGCGADHPDFQFLTPPYLYDASGKLAVRPSITTAPTSATAGSSLSVATDRDVASFALVRMSATTHTVNADQRRVPLTIASRNGNAYQLPLPSERGILLPGPWMLFAMDANGVPSVAKIVRIQ